MRKNRDNNIETNAAEPKPVSPVLEREKKLRKARLGRLMTVLDRIFGFVLATVVIVIIGGIGLIYVLTKGPSQSLNEDFVMTMVETRRFDFIGNIFLTAEEVEQIRASNENSGAYDLDANLISISSADAIGAAVNTENFAQDDDGDGIILEEINGAGFSGYLMTVLDPSRVIIGMPDTFGGHGLTLEEMVNKYDAIGGVNGGGFRDEGGTGTGGIPEGLTIIDGECYGDTDGESTFVGFDDEHVMHVGYYTAWSAQQNNIVSGVSFGPALIINGQPVDPSTLPSGVNPRTAVGQRADGAVLFLVIDGRQAHSMGAKYIDCLEIMLSRGAVNAINMDGGSSTAMYFEGDYVNRSSGQAKSRYLPSAFLVK